MKGILFKEGLFKAILRGDKTQTRRAIKLPKFAHDTCSEKDIELQKGTYLEWTPHVPSKSGCLAEIQPRYKKGETLYLKEPFYDYGNGHFGYAFDLDPDDRKKPHGQTNSICQKKQPGIL